MELLLSELSTQIRHLFGSRHGTMALKKIAKIAKNVFLDRSLLSVSDPSIDKTFVQPFPQLTFIMAPGHPRKKAQNTSKMFQDAKDAIQKYLDACPTEVIRRFINRSWRFMSEYRQWEFHENIFFGRFRVV